MIIKGYIKTVIRLDTFNGIRKALYTVLNEQSR